MKFTQLRLTGFKSFVDTAELHIDPGLTGIIGPNGCGKSNLLEALRWVMGATSAKSLRGSGMEELIFAGTDNRPARNKADVLLKIDNTDRKAPARFNDADILEVVRKITRGKGSDYSINGEDVRAKDVQLLFADAATGANSAALVRQGQISELINAKPENRRRILEDAAGVAGLRARRREAQLRLNAAEVNLDRLQEVIDDLESRHSALQKQARQAARYRKLAAEIREFESLVWLRRWKEAQASVERLSGELKDTEAVAEEAIRLAASATSQAEDSHNAIQPLREAEAKASAALRLIERERDGLERELETLSATIEQLEARLIELDQSQSREAHLAEEASASAQRLKDTLEQLREKASQDGELEAEAQHQSESADQQRDQAETTLDQLSNELAGKKAERDSLQRSIAQSENRIERLDDELKNAREQIDTDDTADLPDLDALQVYVDESEQDLVRTRGELEDTAKALETARETAEKARDRVLGARSTNTALEREAEGLRRMLQSSQSDDQALDHVTAKPGYEQALAVALGEDLEASLDESADRSWSIGNVEAEALPIAAEPLAKFVEAPAQLKTRLNAIGVVDIENLNALADELKPGQRLVTQGGDLIRWDGLRAQAGAPSSAAARLENRNRLQDVEAALKSAVKALEIAENEATQTDHSLAEIRIKIKKLQDRVNVLQQQHRDDERQLSQGRELQARLNAAQADIKARITQLEDNLKSAQVELNESRSRLEALSSLDELDTRVKGAREGASKARQSAADSRANLDSLRRDAQGRRHRISALERELTDWSRRQETAQAEISRLEDQKGQTESKLAEARALPEQHETRLKALMDRLGDAESEARLARDRVAEMETGQREADTLLRSAEKEASAAREARAACQARLDGARERLTETIERLEDATGDTPEALSTRTETSDISELSSEEIERRLETAKASRERLGAVNLRADEESEELREQRESLTKERDELVEAVSRLRKAVDTLSREGRSRLLEAFEIVDGHFRRLFETLFGGGRAELHLTESDDPLEAGLEIMACPPGKKMENMGLMSGGEQALTATALIFAVFLSNPSPVCVLDEVDAPLDDANVDRFCRLLDEMRRLTETRFLVITHNPVTMARMDRLYGVTMAERGVSQLVSVSLRAAEDLIAAE